MHDTLEVIFFFLILIKHNGEWMFWIIAGSFPLQHQHMLSESRLEVLWELCLKGTPLIRGGDHVEGTSGSTEQL